MDTYTEGEGPDTGENQFTYSMLGLRFLWEEMKDIWVGNSQERSGLENTDLGVIRVVLEAMDIVEIIHSE